MYVFMCNYLFEQNQQILNAEFNDFFSFVFLSAQLRQMNESKLKF